MKPLFIVAIRILAVYLVASSMNNAFPIFFMTESTNSLSDLRFMVVFGYFVFPMLVGIGLWHFAPSVASKACEVESLNGSPTEQDLVRASSFLIGIFWAVRSTGFLLGELSARGSVNYGQLAVFGLSVFLIVGCGFVTKIFERVRAYGAGA